MGLSSRSSWFALPVFLAGLALIFFIVWSTGAHTGRDLYQQLKDRERPQNPVRDRDESVVFLSDQVIGTQELAGTWVLRPAGAQLPQLRVPFRPTVSGNGAIEPAAAKEDPDNWENPGFVGPESCLRCHPENAAGFARTAHAVTSAPVGRDLLSGPTTPPENVFHGSQTDVKVTMLQADRQFRQVVQMADYRIAFPVDVATGSGKTAQTFLYWHGDALYQDHVTYFAGPQRWLPSPGFADDALRYDRPIPVKCLECHATFIAKQPRSKNRYHAKSAIWGVTCERCHGPAADHVAYHTAHPNASSPRAIVHPGTLSRQRQLDICGQCHSGSFTLRKDAFTFRPGDDLSQYHRLANPEASGQGVHTSNQLARLKRSRCFTQSHMTCVTCHNPHRHERGNVRLFSEACLTCHDVSHCGMESAPGMALQDNCIACHMPESSDQTMQDLESGKLRFTVVDHHIRIERTATERFLQQRLRESGPSESTGGPPRRR